MKKYLLVGLLTVVLAAQVLAFGQGATLVGKVIPVWAGDWAIFRSLDEMREVEAKWLADLLGNRVVLTDKLREQLWVVSYEELGIEAELVRLPWGERRDFGQPFGIRFTLDEEQASQALAGLYDHLLDKPKDAYYQISYANKITIVPEQAGELLNYGGMLREIREKMGLEGLVTMAFATDLVAPKVTQKALATLGIETLRGEFATRFNGDDKSRTSNIWLATSSIGEVILQPGEMFSFNEVVGPRTRERGYGEAGVILNNQRVKDFGGGVCQVSSTLYNAARLAGLTIVERHQHSVHVSYVPTGRDAAVVYGDKDLKFQNDTASAVLIKSYFAYGQLTFKIFGGEKDK